MAFKRGIFRISDLVKVGEPPPPDDPPLQIGDWCTLNSGSSPWLVVDATEDEVIVALNDQEHDLCGARLLISLAALNVRP